MDDDMSDEEDVMGSGMGPGMAAPSAPGRKDEEIPAYDSTEAMAEAMDRFFDNTEEALKVFFTSWSYDKGLMWCVSNSLDECISCLS